MPDEPNAPNGERKMILDSIMRLRLDADQREARSEQRHVETTRILREITECMARCAEKVAHMEESDEECEGWRNGHEDHHRSIEGRVNLWALSLIGALVIFILSLFASGKLP